MRLVTSQGANLADIKTVFFIMMENHDWRLIKDDPECPYINNVLLPMSSYANNYRSPTAVHPSAANYIWLEAGTNFGVMDDGFRTLYTTNHLTRQLMDAGISWRAYQESIGGTNCPIYNYYPFVMRHCPSLFFEDIQTNEMLCVEHVRPYEEFTRDLTNHALARYNYITPNLTNDMHDFNDAFTSARAAGDHWLSVEVPKILNSSEYKDNGALFIAWDEGTDFTDGPMGMIILSPLAKGHGYNNSISYTHSATLRTFQEIFGVRPFLGDAALSRDFGDLFQLFSLDAKNGENPGIVTLTVNGVDAGRTVILQRSADLKSWASFATNDISVFPIFEQLIANAPPSFYRAVITN